MVDSIRTHLSKDNNDETYSKYMNLSYHRLSTEQQSRLSKGQFGETSIHTFGSTTKDILESQSNRPSVDQRKPLNFAGEKIIGNGSFGVVFQARIAETGEVVAVKKICQDRRYKNRELQVMQELDHSNVVKLKYSFLSQGEAGETLLNLVMDYLPETLYRVFKYYKKQKKEFPPFLIKLYSYQMFRALAFIHSKNIVHRDFKPQNLLVDPRTHILKVCDFGSSKKLVPGENNVSYICSRYYRAPELIFGSTNYTTAIDIWAAGCVIGELLLGEPLFPGETGLTQLIEIIKVLGNPTTEQILEMNPKTTEEFKFPKIQAKPWKKVFKSKVDPQLLDLLTKLLIYSPDKRLRATDILAHSYFDELRSSTCNFEGKPLPDLFSFSNEELANFKELKDKLIPEWYRNNKELY